MKTLIALILCAATVFSFTGCVQKNESKAEEPKTEITEPIAGGWNKPESDKVTEEARAALEKALDGMVGAHYEPLALMGTQVVAGMNYCILCEITPVVPDAMGRKALVYVYADLDCNAEITEIVDCEDENSGSGTGVGIANPFVDYVTLAEAEKAAGFELTAPETVKGYDGEKLIQVMSNRMIQIIFHDAEDNRLFVRKEAGSDDISGDYNVYAEIQTLTVDDRAVTMKGNDGLVSVAIWTEGDYTYAVTADTPMAPDAMTALVAAVA